MQTETTLIIDSPTPREKALAALARLYKLQSGCGALVNSGLFKRLAGGRKANLWADVEGGRALVPIQDFIGRSMFFAGDLDRKITTIIDQYVSPGDVALDIGANLGLVALKLGSAVGSEGAVHAFEPNPKMLNYLNVTLKENQPHSVTVHPIALGAENTQLTLRVPLGDNAGLASFVNVNEDFSDYQVQVPVRRLTDYLNENSINRLDFIKIDVEGFEADVFRGGMEALKTLRPKAVVFEENNYKQGDGLSDQMQLLRELDYKLYALPRTFFRIKLTPVENVATDGARDFVALRPDYAAKL